MTEPKTASELEALIRERTGADGDAMTVSVRPVPGDTPNWTCIVRYANPGHGMGPDAAFVRKVAALQRAFRLQD